MDNAVFEKEYRFNAFLSWTGADRALKEQIRVYFEQKFQKENCCYDSDLFCKGDYREDFTEAMSKSKVYVMILTDGLLENVTSEVKGEVRCAKDFENIGDLNIVILCTTSKLRNGAYDYLNLTDTQKFYYTYTSGYSRIDAATDENGLLSEADLEKLFVEVNDFVVRRDGGRPVPPVDIFGNVYHCKENKRDEDFIGRKEYIKRIENAFDEGAQVIILHGVGGIGKTCIAKEFAKEYDAENKCRFLQVVKLVRPDNQTSMSGLKLLVTKTMYKTSFKQSLASLNEDDAYKQELQEMQKLGPYCLILVDSYDKVDEDSIAEILRNLNCRLIMTTRSNVDENLKDGKYVKTIEVLPMEEEEAYKLFSRQYKNGSFEDFKRLYEELDGHTFLINLAARLLKQHGMTLEELISKLKVGGLGSLDEEVKSTYNGSDKESVATLLGHLGILFEAGCLDDKEIDILKKLSLLLEGKALESDVKTYFGQSNRNVLNKLLDMGLLKLETENDEHYFMMLQIVSQFILLSFDYTEEDMAPPISYVLDKYRIVGEDMQFSTALAMEPNVYYALYWYAKKLRRLHRELWQRFTQFNTVLGDYENVTVEIEQLAALLTSEQERGVLKLFDACSRLQMVPDNAKDADTVSIPIDETNYMEVVRLMPMIAGMQTQFGQEEYKSCVTDLFSRILQVAMRENDDHAINFCIICLIMMGADVSKYKGYIKKNASLERPQLYILKMMLTSGIYKVFASGDIIGAIKDPEAKLRQNKQIYLHIFSFLKVYKEISNYDGSDPLLLVFKTISQNVDSADDDDIFECIDWESVFAGILQYFDQIQQRGFTLMTKSEYINNIFGIFKLLPSHIQGDLQKYVGVSLQGYDIAEATIGDMGKFLLASEVCWETDPKLAIEYCDTALSIQLKHHAKASYATIEQIVQVANQCVFYKQYAAAHKYFSLALDIIGENKGFDNLRGQICSSVLKLLTGYTSSVKVENLDEVLARYKNYIDAALGVCQTGSDKCIAYGDYILALFKIVLFEKRNVNAGASGTEARYISTLRNGAFAASIAKELKSYMKIVRDSFGAETLSKQLFLSDCIFNVIYRVPLCGYLKNDKELYEETTHYLLDEYRRFASCRFKEIRKLSEIQRSFLVVHFASDYLCGDYGDAEELKNIIEDILSKRMANKRIFVTVLSSYLSELGVKYKGADIKDLLDAMFDGDEKYVSPFYNKAQSYEANALCIRMNGFLADSSSPFFARRKEFNRLKGSKSKRRKEIMRVMMEAALT